MSNELHKDQLLTEDAFIRYQSRIGWTLRTPFCHCFKCVTQRLFLKSYVCYSYCTKKDTVERT